MLKLNGAENYEKLCDVVLTKDKFPIAFENKVQELMEECGYSREKAEELVPKMKMEIEIYYHKGFGCFAVDSEACEAGTIYSPYSGELLEDSGDY
jgi:hypothetical protein